jgi:hypothetical protein
VGEDVAADVEKHDEVGFELGCRLREAGGD